MATWPQSLKYSTESWEYSPSVSRTIFSSNNVRQRQVIADDDYRFNVTLSLNSSQLSSFEDFVLNDLNEAADQYQGPYYIGDVEYIGTLQPSDDNYQVSHLGVGHWDVTYSFDLINRDMTNENNAYELVVEMEGFGPLFDLMDALENAINTSDYYE